MHRGKIVHFALAMKGEGMPLPNPPVDGANDLPLPLPTLFTRALRRGLFLMSESDFPFHPRPFIVE
jgi:hypothetical protein